MLVTRLKALRAAAMLLLGALAVVWMLWGVAANVLGPLLAG